MRDDETAKLLYRECLTLAKDVIAWGMLPLDMVDLGCISYRTLSFIITAALLMMLFPAISSDNDLISPPTRDILENFGGGVSEGLPTTPVGASGTRITLHLLHVLRRTNSRYGVATLCIGGGQGGAILLENTESA